MTPLEAEDLYTQTIPDCLADKLGPIPLPAWFKAQRKQHYMAEQASVQQAINQADKAIGNTLDQANVVAAEAAAAHRRYFYLAQNRAARQAVANDPEALRALEARILADRRARQQQVEKGRAEANRAAGLQHFRHVDGHYEWVTPERWVQMTAEKDALLAPQREARAQARTEKQAASEDRRAARYRAAQAAKGMIFSRCLDGKNRWVTQEERAQILKGREERKAAHVQQRNGLVRTRKDGQWVWLTEEERRKGYEESRRDKIKDAGLVQRWTQGGKVKYVSTAEAELISALEVPQFPPGESPQAWSAFWSAHPEFAPPPAV